MDFNAKEALNSSWIRPNRIMKTCCDLDQLMHKKFDPYISLNALKYKNNKEFEEGSQKYDTNLFVKLFSEKTNQNN